MNRKVILTIAPTGGQLTKAQTPFVPTQPDEIAADVARCRDAGASMAALHARRPDDQATCNPTIYREINSLVRERCDIVIANSTGGGFNGDMSKPGSGSHWESLVEERSRGAEGGAEVCSINAMSVLGRDGDRNVMMSASLDESRQLAQKMLRLGVKPEWEAFSATPIIQDISTLIGEGLGASPPWISLCFGLQSIFQGGVPFTTRTMQYMVDQLPDSALFNVSGQGEAQIPAVTTGLFLGGHIRVGIEDSRWDARGELRPNAWFVEWAVRLIESSGFEVASPDEARALLGLPSLPV